MVVLMKFFRQLLHQRVGDQAGGDHSPEAPPSISQLLQRVNDHADSDHALDAAMS